MPTVGRRKIRAIVKVASWQPSGRHFGRHFGNRVALGEVPYDFARGESGREGSSREISNPFKLASLLSRGVQSLVSEKLERFPFVPRRFSKFARKERTDTSGFYDNRDDNVT